MSSRTLILALGTVLLCLFVSAQANATNITLFTSRAAFVAASTNLQNINFEGIAPPNSVTPQLPSLTLLGVTFSNNPNTVSVVDPGFFAPLFDFGSGASLSGITGFTLDLPAGTTAIGADIMTALGAGPFEVVFATGETFSVLPGNATARAFVGFISDTAITSLRFTRSQGIPFMDNVAFGQAVAPVPEPTSMLLLGTGLAAISLRRRLRRNRRP